MCEIASIILNYYFSFRVEMRQDQRLCKPLFEFFKRYVLLLSPAESLFVPFQRFRYWLAYFREVFNKPSLEICKAKKNLNLFY